MRLCLCFVCLQGGGLLNPLRALWKGVGATLAKDIPFAALFWMLLEPLRSNLQPGGLLPLHNLWSPASQDTGDSTTTLPPAFTCIILETAPDKLRPAVIYVPACAALRRFCDASC